MSIKLILLNSFIVGFVILNLLIFVGIYLWISPPQTNPQTYQQNLNNYLKEYSQQENLFQQFSFYSNYAKIVLNNTQVNEIYLEGINNFTNLTQQEFYQVYEIIRKIMKLKNYGEITKFGENYNDWSTNKSIIKDQCGYNSSYIFAVLTAIQYQINRHKQNQQWITLSAQQIIDCCSECLVSKKPQTVLEYVKQNGVLSAKQYPYQNSRFSKQAKKCRRSEKSGKKYFIEGYRSIKNCQALQKQIANNPLVVGVDGRNFPEYHYSIFTKCQRKTTHYATLVGISYDHWKLQNSWGTKWGERGFIRIGPGDTCGVCLRGSVPILTKI